MIEEFKTKPFSHQLKTYQESRDLASFAVFWEQGTGKSKLIIDTVAHLYRKGALDGLLVVAPGGVELNWITDELPTHLPDDVASSMSAVVYKTGKAGTKWHQEELARLVHHKGLAVLTMSYDAFVTPRGKKLAFKFMQKRKLMHVLDESHNIKTPAAKRTQSIVRSGRYSPFRRILTGTPISQGPFDIYSQMRFLEPGFWASLGIGTYAEFKAHFGIWKQERNHNTDTDYNLLLDYQNLDQLYEMIASHSSRVLKDDVLDLPPKLYSKRYFDLSPEQARVYKQLSSEFSAEWSDADAPPCTVCGGTGEISLGQSTWGEAFEACDACMGTGKVVNRTDAALAIVRLLRLQQVTCGYLPSGDEDVLKPIGDTYPRLDLLRETTEQITHQGIIWARFTRDIELIYEELRPLGTCYYGGQSDEQNARSKNAFKAGDRQWLIANPAKGATGLTLTEAKTVIYYNNSFKLIDRLQSEDRAHRIGQDHPVDYIDIIAQGTVDRDIVTALRAKLDIASQINGDRLKEWL